MCSEKSASAGLRSLCGLSATSPREAQEDIFLALIQGRPQQRQQQQQRSPVIGSQSDTNDEPEVTMEATPVAAAAAGRSWRRPTAAGGTPATPDHMQSGESDW